MATFRFQCRYEDEARVLAESAELKEFEPSKKNMVIEFDGSKVKGYSLANILAKHIFMGSQNVHVTQSDGVLEGMVVCPQTRIEISPDVYQVRYFICARSVV